MAGAHDQVLNIEPANTSLSVPATLTLRLESDSQQGTVHHFTDGVWIPLDTQEVSGGGLEVTISYLGAFAVVAPAIGGASDISGIATWSPGLPVVDESVSLLRDGRPFAETRTDSGGAYRFAELDPGTYTIQLNLECPFEKTVEVTAGEPTTVDIPLCQ